MVTVYNLNLVPSLYSNIKHSNINIHHAVVKKTVRYNPFVKRFFVIRIIRGKLATFLDMRKEFTRGQDFDTLRFYSDLVSCHDISKLLKVCEMCFFF